MTVFFVGAGPGASDLITVRGLRLIERCPVCLYAGSLIPSSLLLDCPSGARILDTSSLSLPEIISEITSADELGHDVCRLHSGDPSIYGAIGEQMRRLDSLGIDYEVVPGVPSFAGVAARLRLELTLPEISQTIILTRTEMKASSMPSGERLEELGRSGATLAIHLSVRNLDYIRRSLTPHYGEDCPVIVAYRATWDDELYFRTTLSEMKSVVRESKITRTALILVGRVLGDVEFRDSDLYNPDYSHVLRNRGKKKKTKKG